MESLFNIKSGLESILRQLDREPGYIETLYCQKSTNEAIFWIGKLIDRLEIEKQVLTNKKE